MTHHIVSLQQSVVDCNLINTHHLDFFSDILHINPILYFKTIDYSNHTVLTVFFLVLIIFKLISGQKYNNLKQQYEMKSHELELIRERLKTTRHHQLAQEVEEMQVFFFSKKFFSSRNFIFSCCFYFKIYFYRFKMQNSKMV